MFCPKCGSQLELVERTPFPYNDEWYELPPDEQDEYQQLRMEYEACKREEYKCLGGCFREDYPLYFHHPFRGIESEPGDSWSLSWVE